MKNILSAFKNDKTNSRRSSTHLKVTNQSQTQGNTRGGRANESQIRFTEEKTTFFKKLQEPNSEQQQQTTQDAKDSDKHQQELPENCTNIAQMDEKHISQMKNWSFSHFQDELSQHLDQMIKMFDSGPIQTKPTNQKEENNQTPDQSQNKGDNQKSEAINVYETLKNINVKSNLEEVLPSNQAAVKIENLNQYLQIFNAQFANQLASQYQETFTEILKQSFTSESVSQFKSAAQFYLDVDQIVEFIKKLPKFKKPNILQQIQAQIFDFVKIFYKNSKIELFDPDFQMRIETMLDSVQEQTKDQNEVTSKLVLNQIFSELQSITRQRLAEFLKFFAKQDTYYVDQKDSKSLNQLLNLQTGDSLLTTNLKNHGVSQKAQKNAQNYVLYCSLGRIFSKYILGSLPLLSYYHDAYKIHYYSTNYNELQTFKKEKMGLGFWKFSEVLGYVMPNRIPGTTQMHKFYNKSKNKFLFTNQIGDLTEAESEQIWYLNKKTNNEIVQNLLKDTFQLEDRFIYLGQLGNILKPKTCLE